ncbi:hypothetical protein V1224_01420 [Lachnospiraceae bacterium JLR.KK008]
MKCCRVGLLAEVYEYEQNKEMEDGFELLSDVVTKGWTVTDLLVKMQREDGSIVCPYIKHRRGRTFIEEGDYIIVDEDGTRHVCGKDKIFTRYQKVDEE